MADEEQEATALASFQAVTEAPAETAKFYLSAANGDLQRAVDMFLSGALCYSHLCTLSYYQRTG